MDRYAFGALIPVVSIFFTGLIVLSFTRLGRAIANRIEGRTEGRIDRGTEARLTQLEEANEELRHALAEANERIDFTERAIMREALPRIPTPV